MFGVCSFIYAQLSCKARLVYLHRYSFEQFAISRNLVTYLKQNDITNYNIFFCNLLYISVAHHHNLVFVVHLIEDVKLFVSIHFEPKRDACCQKNSTKNTDSLYILIMYNRNP